MPVCRLAVALVCFWNLSLGYCLVGRSGTSTASKAATRTRKTINGVASRGVLPALSKPPMRAPSTTTATAAAKATESTIPTAGGDSRVAWVFPSSKERFRNLTRAIEYSVVHNEDWEDGQEHESVDETYRSISIKRLREMNHHVMVFQEQFAERNRIMRIRTPTDTDPHPTSAASVVPASETTGSAANSSRNKPLSSSWLLLVTRLARAFLRSFSLWCWIMGKHSLKKMRKIFTLGRRRRKEGFSETDLGGTKRHYALLVASLVNGARGLTATTPNSNMNGGGYSCDPVAYHHSIVQSVHHRTVASLSPSPLLLISEKKETGGIRVSALQRHALKWALRNDKNKSNKKRNRNRKLRNGDEHT